jgi:protease-4
MKTNLKDIHSGKNIKGRKRPMKGFLSRFLLGFFTGVGLITFIVVIFLTISYFYFFGTEKALPKKMVLNFEFQGQIVENSSDNPFEYLGLGHVLSTRTIIESIDRAAEDDRIEGIIFRTLDPELSLSQAEEIRETIQRFKEKGKFAYFYTDSFGDSSWATVPYYLASIFDEIWMQPSGTLGLVGIAAEFPFFKRAMEAFGVEAQYGTRYEYKSAPSMYLYDTIPPAHLEMQKSLFTETSQFVLNAIAKDHEIELAKLKALVDEAPLLAEKAIDEKLVHHLGYWDQFKSHVKEKKEGAEWVKFADYIKSLKPSADTKQKIAIIYAEGDIIRGRTPPFGIMPGGLVGGETIAKAIRQAVKDEDVIAIILRINSPGGSHLGSDMVWREVMRAKEAKKPIIASLAGVAASGGYFMAMGADRIIANESTITGSIGVYSGKFTMEKFWEKIRVKWDGIKEGQNADMWSQNTPFSETAFKNLNEGLDFIYKDFTQKVSLGRNIPAQKLDSICRGRVWTGSQALANGLVDQIGGYREALKAAKKAAGIPVEKPLKVEVFPRSKSLAERVVQYIEDIEDMTQTSKGMAAIAKIGVNTIAPVLEEIEYKKAKSKPNMRYQGATHHGLE